MNKMRKLSKIVVVSLFLLGAFSGWVIYKKNMHIWLPDYLRGAILNIFSAKGEYPKHILFIFVDHFEPYFKTNSDAVAKRRMDAWMINYPKIAALHRDRDGRYPQHSWFFPQDMLSEDLYFLKKLTELSARGFGEIEMHLHHQNDTVESFREKIASWKKAMGEVEGLGRRQYFAFIAGNWALDNSRLKKERNFSGVNNELIILKEEGCFADFTFPSIYHTAQPAKVNSIYYAEDNPDKPKSYNWGIDVSVGKKPNGDLLIVEGPLSIAWYSFFKRLKPSLEDGNICETYPPFKERIDNWIKRNIHIRGQSTWIFVKIFTHGCEDNTIPIVLGKPLHDMFTYLETKYNDGKKYILHYVTAREAYNIIKAAEAGMKGNPGDYRDFIIQPYIERKN